MYKIYIKKGKNSISVIADYFRISYDENEEVNATIFIRTGSATLSVYRDDIVTIKKYEPRTKKNR